MSYAPKYLLSMVLANWFETFQKPSDKKQFRVSDTILENGEMSEFSADKSHVSTGILTQVRSAQAKKGNGPQHQG